TVGGNHPALRATRSGFAPTASGSKADADDNQKKNNTIIALEYLPAFIPLPRLVIHGLIKLLSVADGRRLNQAFSVKSQNPLHADEVKSYFTRLQSEANVSIR